MISYDTYQHPLNGVQAFQLGLIVDDMDEAVKAHTAVYGIRNWYRTRNKSIEYFYKGRQREIELDLVVGYCKGSQVELIQVLKGEDNAYVELLLKENLPHTGIMVRDWDAKYQALIDLGYPEIHRITINLKGISRVRVAYFDCRDTPLGVILEVIEVKSLGINLGMPKRIVQAALATGDVIKYKPVQVSV